MKKYIPLFCLAMSVSVTLFSLPFPVRMRCLSSESDTLHILMSDREIVKRHGLCPGGECDTMRL